MVTETKATQTLKPADPFTQEQQEFARNYGIVGLKLVSWQNNLSSADRDFLMSIPIGKKELEELLETSERVRQITLQELKEKHKVTSSSKSEIPAARHVEPQLQAKSAGTDQKNEHKNDQRNDQKRQQEPVKEEVVVSHSPSKNDQAMPKLFLPAIASLIHGMQISMNYPEVREVVKKRYDEMDKLFTQPVFEALNIESPEMRSNVKHTALYILLRNFFKPISCQQQGNYHVDALARVLAQRYQSALLGLPMGTGNEESKNALSSRKSAFIAAIADKYAPMFGEGVTEMRELVEINFDSSLQLVGTMIY